MVKIMGILSRKACSSQAFPPLQENPAAMARQPPDPGRRGLPRLLLGLALVAAAGCGRKGDLYLPAPGDGDDPDAPADGPAPGGSRRE